MSRLKPEKWNKNISTYNSKKVEKKTNVLLLLGEILNHVTGKHLLYFFFTAKDKNKLENEFTHIMSHSNWILDFMYSFIMYNECRFDKLKIISNDFRCDFKGRGTAFCVSGSVLLRSKIAGEVDREVYIHTAP